MLTLALCILSFAAGMLAQGKIREHLDPSVETKVRALKEPTKLDMRDW